MKKFVSVLMLMAVVLTVLSGCLPVDGEPEAQGA